MEAGRRATGAPNLLDLPTELQLLCLGFAADAASLCSALASCSLLNGLRELALEAFCHRTWPQIALVAADAVEGAGAPDKYWQNVAHSCQMVASASAATIDPARTFNSHVKPATRGTLTEWLIEVSHEWQLDGATVFVAVRVIDAFLASKPLNSVTLLQLVGICALRIAMQVHELGGDFASWWRRRQRAQAWSILEPSPQDTDRQVHPYPNAHLGSYLNLGFHRGLGSLTNLDFDLDPGLDNDLGLAVDSGTYAGTIEARSAECSEDDRAATTVAMRPDPFPTARFAELCNESFSASEVDIMTSAMGDFVVPHLGLSPFLTAPTARHFLRGLWAAALRQPPPPAAAAAAAVVPAPARGAVLHLAGFLLHLSLMDPRSCAAPPPHVAAAAISLALEALGLAPWPPALRRELPLRLTEDLEPLRERIVAAQLRLDVPHLRRSWMRVLHRKPWCLHVQSGRWVKSPDEDEMVRAYNAAAAREAVAAGGAAQHAARDAGGAGDGGAPREGRGARGAGARPSVGDGASAGACGDGGGAGDGRGGDVGSLAAAIRRRVEAVVAQRGPLSLP